MTTHHKAKRGRFLARISYLTHGVRDHAFAMLDDVIQFCDARFSKDDVVSVAVVDLETESKPLLHWRARRPFSSPILAPCHNDRTASTLKGPPSYAAPMNEKRFHRDAYGLPRLSFSRLDGFRLTRHAAERMVEKNIRVDVSALTTFDSASWSVFEAVKRDDAIVKLAARKPLGNGYDLCAVFAVDARAVVTVWLNRTNDRHSTLDRSLYTRP